MILVDSNVLMYAAGSDHPNKSIAVEFLARVATGEVDAAIDAEVLQEIIHRYRAIHRWSEGRTVFLLARKLFPDVIPITGEVMDRSKLLVDADETVSARDAVHAAVLLVNKLDGIYTFDRDFDRIRGIKRIEQ